MRNEKVRDAFKSTLIGLAIITPLAAFFLMMPAFAHGHYVIGGLLLLYFAVFFSFAIGHLIQYG